MSKLILLHLIAHSKWKLFDFRCIQICDLEKFSKMKFCKSISEEEGSS